MSIASRYINTHIFLIIGRPDIDIKKPVLISLFYYKKPCRFFFQLKYDRKMLCQNNV